MTLPHRSTVLTVLLAVTGLALAGLAVQHWRLSNRVAALEAVAAQQLVQQAVPETSTVEALQTAMTAWRDAQDGDGSMSQAEAAELVQTALDSALQTTLDDALDRRAEARQLERKERFLTVAEQGIRGEVEELAADYGLTEAQVSSASEVMVQGLQDGMELRGSVLRGDVTLFEARSEGQAIRESVQDTLTDVLGVDAFEELGRRLHGEDGWAAARGLGRGPGFSGGFRP